MANLSAPKVAAMGEPEREDARIQLDVLSELQWDTRVDETDVGVEVDAGVVTLTGAVGSWAKRVAAQEAAHRVRGVLDVANDVRVKTSADPELSDADIAHAVRRALEWDVQVPDERIRTTVTDGAVTLEGSVDNWNQREDAELAVRNLHGVRSVRNELTVQPEALSPVDIQHAIRAALGRRAEEASKHVHVVVSDGKVLLSGHVRSAAEKQAIVEAAKGTIGVRSIESHIAIEP